MLAVYCPEGVFKIYSTVNVGNIRFNCFIGVPTVHRVYSALVNAVIYVDFSRTM